MVGLGIFLKVTCWWLGDIGDGTQFDYCACPLTLPYHCLPLQHDERGQALLPLLIIPHQFWAVVLANQPLLCVSLIARWID